MISFAGQYAAMVRLIPDCMVGVLARQQSLEGLADELTVSPQGRNISTYPLMSFKSMVASEHLAKLLIRFLLSLPYCMCPDDIERFVDFVFF